MNEDELKVGHYDFTYKLTKDDIEKGEIKIDPYWYSQQVGIANREPTGGLFHIFKTVVRFGNKNSTARELDAIQATVNRMRDLLC